MQSNDKIEARPILDLENVHHVRLRSTAIQ